MSNPNVLHIALIYLTVINVVTFLLYGIDKFKAQRSRWRIPESVLLGLAVVGGSVGAWLGMMVWHHKTQHKKFKYGIPLILALQIALLFLVSCKTGQAVETVKSQPENRYIPEHSPDVFLISYDARTGKEPVLKAIKKYRCEIVYDYHTFSGMALKKPKDKTLEETMQYFRGVKGVLTVEYDYITRLDDPVKPKLEER